MAQEIVVAIITSGASFAVAVVSIVMNNRVLGYKVDDLKKDFERLEEKVEKHNNLVERMALVEQSLKTNWRSTDELKAEVKDIRDK